MLMESRVNKSEFYSKPAMQHSSHLLSNQSAILLCLKTFIILAPIII